MLVLSVTHARSPKRGLNRDHAPFGVGTVLRASGLRPEPPLLMKKFIPLLLAVAAVLLYAWRQYDVSIEDNGGRLVYALDDAYIHMAVSRNLAEHGVWGVTPEGFTSSSSSILWPLILALAFKLFGVTVLMPYLLNVVFIVLALALAEAMLRPAIPSAVARAAVLLALLFGVPFAPLLTGGMEHTLQIAVMLAFVGASAKALANPDPSPRAGAAPWMFLTGLLVAFVRYESAFVALVVCGLLFARRRYIQAVVLGLLVLLPVVVYGWISVRQGWYFFPNPILLKSDSLNAGGESFLVRAFSREGFFYWRLFNVPHLFFLVILAAAVFLLRFERAGFWESWQQKLLIFVAGSVLHMQFADTGWFYRYEAYLMALGGVAVAGAAGSFVSEAREAETGRRPRVMRAVAVALFAAFLLVPSARHGVAAWRDAPRAMHDRYLEHIVPVEFIQRYYSGEPVMVNDLGAISFLSDARPLDIFGLGSMEAARPKIESHGASGMTAERVREWGEREGAKLGLIQLEWRTIRYVVPNEWILIGIWEIPRNVIFPDKLNIGWFAPNVEEARALAAALEENFPRVPSSIRQHGIYLGQTFEEMSDLIKARERRTTPDDRLRLE